MSEIDPSTELAQIEAKVATLCEGGLTGRAYYLLSELGKALGEDLVRLKVLGKTRLAEFIEARLGDRFSVVGVGLQGKIKAVVHADATQPAPGGVAAPTTEVSRQEQASPKLRYHYRFWAAFAVPSDGRIRYLNLDDLTFDDRDEEETPEGHVAIESKYIAPEGLENRDKSILANIESWLSAKGLAQDQFLERHGRRREPNAVALDRREVTALDAMISALDRRQLAATSLSLDVVAALLRKRV